MNSKFQVTIVSSDDELLEIVPLKQADDSECIGKFVLEDLIFDKIVNFKEEGSDFWIARFEQQAIGYGTGILNGRCYRSRGIYVSPKYRCMGIGFMLKRAQIDYARDLNCKEIYSNVSSTNLGSVRVQEKAGFEFEPSGTGYIVRLSLD